MRRLRLTESFEPRLEQMSAAPAAALAASGLVDVTVVNERQVLLSPTTKVGAVVAGDLQVEVWPKERVRISHLLFMLGYSADPGFKSETVLSEQHDELWPVVAESLARLAERALRHGVLQGYRTVDETSTVVRGRIRVADQIRVGVGRSHPTEISYDEYLTDISENRILRTALKRIRPVPGLDSGLQKRISHLYNRLDGVTVLRPRDPRPHWRESRLNSHYSPALRLSELILSSMSAQAGPGGVRTASFVVSMWKVFEDFVTTALSEAVRTRGERTQAQYRVSLDQRVPGQRGVPMSVDLVGFRSGRPELVFDAKYKAASGSGSFPNADYYQMLAYCTAMGVSRSVLVYARGSARMTRTVSNSDVEIIEWPLDLSQSPDAMLASIDQLVEEAYFG